MKLQIKNMKQMNLITNITKKLLLLLMAVSIMGCFNCEDHMNDEIRPMFIKATITEIDTVIDRPLKLYFSSKESGDKSISFGSCGDFNAYRLRGKIQIGDSLLKEVGTDTFKIKQPGGKVLVLEYQCCVL